MKAHLAKVSLALLSAAFLLGCQDLGSDPLGPDGLGPEFKLNCDSKPADHPCKGGGGGDDDDGKPNPGSPFYAYTFTAGDITTNPSPAGARTRTGGTVNLQACCDEKKEILILSGDLVDLFDTRCFDPGEEDIQFAEFIGDLRPDKKNMNKVEAVLLLKGLNGSGTGDILYRLLLEGGPNENADSDDDDIFPPELAETTAVTFINASMEAQSRSERNKNACSADDLTGLNIVVEVTGTDQEPDDTPQ